MTIGTHRVILDGQVKLVRWNEEKNSWLIAHRRIDFDFVATLIELERYLAVVDHWNPARYPNQRIFILAIDGYAYYVPFVESPHDGFLKTVIRSRKATRLYLRGD